MVDVLVADDDPELRYMFGEILDAAGYNVETVENGIAAKKALSDRQYDVVVTDLIMGKGDGVEVATFAHDLPVCPKLILMTGGGTRLSAHDAVEMSRDFFDLSLVKPISKDILLGAVNAVLQMNRGYTPN